MKFIKIIQDSKDYYMTLANYPAYLFQINTGRVIIYHLDRYPIYKECYENHLRQIRQEKLKNLVF